MRNDLSAKMQALEDAATALRAAWADLLPGERRTQAASLADRRVNVSRRIIEAADFSDADLAALNALLAWCPSAPEVPA